MTADTLTVMWKEWRALFRQTGGKGLAATSLPAILLMAFFFPWLAGVDWVRDPLSLAACVMIPTLFAVLILPDSFAGERERRTLPTLLASRLPDRAILYGKIGMAVSLGWGVTLIVLLLGLVTVNIAHWDGQLLLYSPTIALGNIVLSGLIATLASAAGALVSLRATSVQEAIQAVAMVFMVPGMAVGGLLLIVGAVLGPELKDWLADLDFSQIILSVAVVLALIDLAVLKAVKARFRRSQLTLV